MENNSLLTSDTSAELNILLEYLHDSYNGYHESAQDIEDFDLQQKFMDAAQRRDQMIKELERVLISDNTKPAEKGTIAGAAHRVFVNLKSIITGKDEEAILNEVTRGENFLIEKYQEALKNVDSPILVQLLNKQSSEIKQDLIKWKFIKKNS